MNYLHCHLVSSAYQSIFYFRWEICGSHLTHYKICNEIAEKCLLCGWSQNSSLQFPTNNIVVQLLPQGDYSTDSLNFFFEAVSITLCIFASCCFQCVSLAYSFPYIKMKKGLEIFEKYKCFNCYSCATMKLKITPHEKKTLHQRI